MTKYKLEILTDEVELDTSTEILQVGNYLAPYVNYEEIIETAEDVKINPSGKQEAIGVTRNWIDVSTTLSLSDLIGQYVRTALSTDFIKCTRVEVGTVTITSSSGSVIYHRAKLYGYALKLKYFDISNEDIVSLESNIATNVTGEELVVDTFTPTVKNKYGQDGVVYLTTSDDPYRLPDTRILAYRMSEDKHQSLIDWKNIPYGADVKWYKNDDLLYRFYNTKVTRVKKEQYKLDCVSSIGLLANSMDNGFMALANNRRPFKEILDSIINIDSSYRYFDILPATGYSPAEYWFVSPEQTEDSSVDLTYLNDGDYLTQEYGFRIRFKTPSSWTENIGLFGMIDSVNIGSSESSRPGVIVNKCVGMLINTSGELMFHYGTKRDVISSITFGPDEEHDVGFMNVKIGETEEGEDIWRNMIWVDGEWVPGYSETEDSSFGVNFSPYFPFMSCEHRTDSSTYSHSPMAGGIGYDFYIYKHGNIVAHLLPAFKERDISSNYDINSGFVDIVTKKAYIDFYSFAGYSRAFPYAFGIKVPTALLDYQLGRTTAEGNKIKALNVYGHLPYATKRDNLHALLYAYNLSLIRDSSGKYVITWLEMDDMIPSISDDDVYINGEVKYSGDVSLVQVKEHTYLPPKENETSNELFSTTMPVVDALVDFSSSFIDISTITTDGDIIIKDATPNTLTVCGEGSIRGISYQHFENTSELRNELPYLGSSVESSDNELVNTSNSQAILDKLFEYYTKANAVTDNIVFNGQRTGQFYNLIDPFYERISGFLSKMVLNASAKIKADTTFITNYSPNGSGGILTYYQTYISDGTVDFSELGNPEVVKVVLIGGGDGGQDGFDGEDGHEGQTNKKDWGEGGDGRGGEGGLGGTGGLGGRVYIFTLENPTGTMSFTIGAGGTHYAGETKPLSANGEATTATYDGAIYTSNSGGRVPFVNPMNGDVFALNGTDGVDGGAGGSTDSSQTHSSTSGEDVVFNEKTYYGTIGTYSNIGSFPNGLYSLNNGNGGGGSAKNETSRSNHNLGFYATDAIVHRPSDENNYYQVFPGYGDPGRDATDRDEASELVYGQGGYGGHGGGGGGAGGLFQWNGKASDYILDYLQIALGGRGGYGGAALDGKQGILILLY